MRSIGPILNRDFIEISLFAGIVQVDLADLESRRVGLSWAVSDKLFLPH